MAEDAPAMTRQDDEILIDEPLPYLPLRTQCYEAILKMSGRGKPAFESAISIADFWDKYAQAITLGETGTEGENLVEWMCAYLPEFPLILEVGCGNGRIYKLIDHAVHMMDYDMCDISPEMIKRCRQRTGVRPALLESDILPYDDNAYDLVISYSVLLHIPPANIAQHLAELARVSRRYVFVSTFDNSGDEPLTMYCFRHPYNDLFDAAGLEVVLFKAFRETRTSSYWLQKRGNDA